mmetsp:Transcript_48582/g.77314  ORF Transcript_48582/g.77314 Transcript_48582/m.77314 type:complete len:549 (+) Transcript_48582:53-1699(+)
MRAIQESVARSRQAALERTLQRQAEEEAAQEALKQKQTLRLKKERCLEARHDLIQAVNMAHEDDALDCLEEMRGHLDVLVATDEYGSTLLHEACSRGMYRLAMAVLDETEEDQESLFQLDYRGQTPLHRAATAGSGEICAALCKLPLCQKSLKDSDGFTALQIAQRWGFSAAADAIFRAINPMPELELQVLAPPTPPEEVVEKETKGRLKPGRRGGSKEKRGSMASSQDKRSSLSRGSSQGGDRSGSARSSLKEGKRPSRRVGEEPRRSSGGASNSALRLSRTGSRQSSRQSSKLFSRQVSGSTQDRRASRKNSQDIENCETRSDAGSDTEGRTGEPTSPDAQEASAPDSPENPEVEEGGLTDEEAGEEGPPPPPPLPEDMGYRAGFKAVEDDRLEDALALARSSLWPFTNEVNARGWTLLHLAAFRGFEELCALMCQRKDFKGIDQPEKDFWATALHFAAGKRRPECCRAIVESGRCLDVNAKDNKGHTPLHLAALRGDKESYAAIAAHPECNPLLPDNDGKSALEYAADRGLEVDCQVPGHTEIAF